MRDYELLILERQESEADDCKGCEYLQECRDGVKVGGCVWNADYDDNYSKHVDYMLRDFLGIEEGSDEWYELMDI